MDQMVEKAESVIWCNTAQQFILGKRLAVAENLNRIAFLTLPKLGVERTMLEVDYNFFRALYERNKGRCKELLEQMTDVNMLKFRRRTANSYRIAQPARGYAKLAHRVGMNVEVLSELVPNELLPVRPLSEYPIPYAFLEGNSA